MSTELWGTLSIYDYRYSTFIRSLLLFDKIVIPIPDAPIDDLEQTEIYKMFKVASYLEEKKAAKIYKWNQEKFNEWQKNTIREGLSVNKRDILYETRLEGQTKAEELKTEFDKNEIIAIPVYGARDAFKEAYSTLNTPQQNLCLEISQFINVPDELIILDQDTPLEYTSLGAIIRLKEKESFQSALQALRKWQFKVIPEVLQTNSKKDIQEASDEFAKMIKRYNEEIEKEKFKKTKIVVTSLLALGALVAAAFGQIPSAIAMLSGAAPHLFSLKESLTPAWKEFRDKEFEPAAVIYEANRTLK